MCWSAMHDCDSAGPRTDFLNDFAGGASTSGAAAAGASTATAGGGNDGVEPMDEDALLQQALAMSMQVQCFSTTSAPCNT